jgi:hypothetical protein
MDRLSIIDGVSRADLTAFNRCRLHSGVVFLSEITTVDGATISRDAWTGTRPRHSPLLWPFQPSPGPKSWQLWRRLLARAFLEEVPKRTTPQTKDLYLLQPLGAWLPNSEWLCQKWSYNYSPSTGMIYHRRDHLYAAHLRRRRSRNHSQVFDATSNHTVTTLPSDSVPVEELSSSVSILAFRGIMVRRQPVPPSLLPSTFDDYIQQLPSWDHRLLLAIDLLDGPALIAHFLLDEPLFLVSDGGAAGEVGSFGTLLATGDVIFVKLSGTTEGTLSGSFRAESYGCLALLRFVYHFRQYHHLDPILCRNTFYCNNEGLIKRLKFAQGPLQPFPRHYLRSDMDLELQILDTIHLLAITIEYTPT